MNKLTLSSLLQNCIFPYEQTQKRILYKIEYHLSIETRQFLEYCEFIHPLECELWMQIHIRSRKKIFAGIGNCLSARLLQCLFLTL